jgi:hypothetical protein
MKLLDAGNSKSELSSNLLFAMTANPRRGEDLVPCTVPDLESDKLSNLL